MRIGPCMNKWGQWYSVELHGTLEGDPVTLSLALPNTIHRNHIYKIKLFSGDSSNLQAKHIRGK